MIPDAAENQYCMTSFNRRLQIGIRLAVSTANEEDPMVWISMRVQPLDAIYPVEPEVSNPSSTQDAECVSTERTVPRAEFFDVTFGCSVSISVVDLLL